MHWTGFAQSFQRPITQGRRVDPIILVMELPRQLSERSISEARGWRDQPVSISIAYGQEVAPVGLFGAVATSLVSIFTDHNVLAVSSPDSQSKVLARVEYEALILQIEGRIGSATLKFGNGPNAELQWSPDSDAFCITEDQNGLTGLYQLTVIGRINGQFSVHRVSNMVSQKFGTLYVASSVNQQTWPTLVGLVRRASFSLSLNSRLTQIATAWERSRPTASTPWCMRVLKSYTQREAKNQFGAMLRPRPSNATDCDLDPKSCYIP